MRLVTLRPALTMPQIYLYRAPIDFFRKQARRYGWRRWSSSNWGTTRSPAPSMPFTNRRRNKISV